MAWNMVIIIFIWCPILPKYFEIFLLEVALKLSTATSVNKYLFIQTIFGCY